MSNVKVLSDRKESIKRAQLIRKQKIKESKRRQEQRVNSFRSEASEELMQEKLKAAGLL